MQIALVLAVIFACIVAVFAIQNSVPVSITFLIWTFDNISLVLIIAVALLTGALFVFFLFIGKLHAKNKQIKSLKKEIAQMQPAEDEESGQQTLSDQAAAPENEAEETMTAGRMEDTMSFKPPKF